MRGLSLPLPLTQLLKRTIAEVSEDNCLGLAAQLAYYYALALFPALVFLVALASFFPQDLLGRVIAAIGPVAPPEVVSLVRKQLESIASAEQSGLLTVGVLGALWSSSSAQVAIIDALNRAYDIEEGRPWWKVRLIAIALTIGLALFVLLAFTLVIAGPELAGMVAGWLGLGRAFEVMWLVVQWPLLLGLVALAIGIVYYAAPDAEQDWVWLTPGSVFATVLWLCISLAFRVYVTTVGDYNATYGALAGAVLLLLWFYLSGLAVLIGAELNAEIEHASPQGKAPGEKRPGQRRRLFAFARHPRQSSSWAGTTPARG